MSPRTSHSRVIKHVRPIVETNHNPWTEIRDILHKVLISRTNLMVSCAHYMVSTILAFGSLFIFFDSEFCASLRAEHNPIKEKSIIWISTMVTFNGMRWIVVPVILPHNFVAMCLRKLGFSVWLESERLAD